MSACNLWSPLSQCQGLRVLLLSIFFTAAHASSASAFIVALDVGHSPTKSGAVSARGVTEYRFNRELADLLVTELKKIPGLKPILCNEKGEDLSLHQRARAINALGPDLLVSIHHDSVQPIYLSQWKHNGKAYSFSDRYQGYSLFISGKNRYADQSLCMAGLLGTSLRQASLSPSLHHAENIPGERRPIIDKEKGLFSFDDLVVIKEANCPAVLLECGIIKNREEELLLGSLRHRVKMVSALSQAIAQFKISCGLPIRKGDRLPSFRPWMATSRPHPS